MKHISSRRLRGKNGNTMSNTKSAIADRTRRQKVLKGFPMRPHNMTQQEQTDYFTGDSIVCLLCGKDYRIINDAHLLRVHNTTQDEYRDMFGIRYGKGLSCGGLTAIRSRQAIERDLKQNLVIVTKESASTRRVARVGTAARQARQENMVVANAACDVEARIEATRKPRKITMEQVKEILTSKETNIVLAEQYNVCITTISLIKNNKHSYTSDMADLCKKGNGLPRGVRKLKSGRYKARYAKKGKECSIRGTYDTPEEAGEAARKFRETVTHPTHN